MVRVRLVLFGWRLLFCNNLSVRVKDLTPHTGSWWYCRPNHSLIKTIIIRQHFRHSRGRRMFVFVITSLISWMSLLLFVRNAGIYGVRALNEDHGVSGGRIARILAQYVQYYSHLLHLLTDHVVNNQHYRSQMYVSISACQSVLFCKIINHTMAKGYLVNINNRRGTSLLNFLLRHVHLYHSRIC